MKRFCTLILMGHLFSAGIAQICNPGFENFAQGSLYPNNRAQISLTECWKEDQNGVSYHSPDWFVIDEFNLIENLGNGFSQIYGNDNSIGYVGLRTCELIQQELSQPLVDGENYALSVFFRVPASLNEIEQTSAGPLPSGGVVRIQLIMSIGEPYYHNRSTDCSGGDRCYDLKVPGFGPNRYQVVEKKLNLNNYEPGKWHQIFLPPFKAKNDFQWLTFQTVSESEDIDYCDSYTLFDDFSLIKEVNCESCVSCSFTSESAVVSCNLSNTGLEPLTFFNLENVKSMDLAIYDISGQFIMSASASCDNGWEDGDWQVHIPPSLNLAAAYYYAYLLVGNDCDTCIKHYTFLYLDDYLGSFNSCECREEGIIKPCCEDQYDAEQYVQTCQTGTLLYQAINDLKVGFNSDFTVENGTDVYFTANNSIEFGPNFKSENNGTFLAEITACSQNKKGNDDFVQKDDNPFKEDESSEDLIQCFPNPSNGFINVLTGFDSNSELTIFSVLGERLGQHTIHGKELTQIELHTAGVYIFSFSSNGMVINKEVIIQ